jgi:molybdopterin-guanine dinucleotide biosynthesis protein A
VLDARRFGAGLDTDEHRKLAKRADLLQALLEQPWGSCTALSELASMLLLLSTGNMDAVNVTSVQVCHAWVTNRCAHSERREHKSIPEHAIVSAHYAGHATAHVFCLFHRSLASDISCALQDEWHRAWPALQSHARQALEHIDSSKMFTAENRAAVLRAYQGAVQPL